MLPRTPVCPFALFQPAQNKHFRKTYELAIILGCCKIVIALIAPDQANKRRKVVRTPVNINSAPM
jgi:hypothetical protein